MRKIYTLLLTLCTASSLFAQIPTPGEFLGYELGERFTPHYRVMDYFELIAEEEPNIKLIEYGETNEYRPLKLAFISAPENFDQLENIRKANLKRTGLLEDAESGFEDIALVWLSYNVHGNEAVSTEASMQVLYDLANKNNTQAQEWLENAVVMIDPCINPDGRERYVNWYQQKVGTPNNPSPDAWEHNEPWPGGRANHYLFDLNRDWAWLTQKESRARLAVYNQWLPHVHADFHEQGVNSPYYFAPAAEPYHMLITDWQRDFQTQIGKNNARYFDEEGWLYFTKEVFDLLYPSYGDTYPIYNGAIGMTFEQGGSGRAGLAVLTEDGDTLTLADRIAHHVTTSLSTIEVSANNASRVVEEFNNFYQQGMGEPAGKYESYVIKKSANKDKWEYLQKLLKAHGIDYSISNSSRNISGFSYQSGANESFKMESGDMILSTHQPKSVLLQVLFEPDAELSDSITYDITAWSIPYAYDLQAYALSSDIGKGEVPTQSDFEQISVQDNAYAYVLAWESLEDVKFLSKVIQAGIKARYADNAFTVNGQSFPAGSIIITRANNRDLGSAFDDTLVEIANKQKQELIAISTGFVDSGNDLGSSSVHYIEPPKVMLVGGEGTSSLAFGEVWYYFEQDIEYPVTVVDTKDIGDVDLATYNTLILPNGRYNDVLDKLEIDEWIAEGGKVIALENAMSYFESSDSYSLSEYSSEEERMRMESQEEIIAEQNKLAAYGGRERRNISNYISGGIFKLQLDNTHPLAMGYPNYYYTLKRGNSRYAYLDGGWNVGIMPNEDALVSGFAGKNVLQKLSQSLVFGVEEKGSGELIYMVDNPLFRAFWYNGKMMFGNAIFLVGQN